MTEAMDDLCSALKDIIETADDELAVELAAAIGALKDQGFRPRKAIFTLLEVMEQACGLPDFDLTTPPSPQQRRRGFRVVKDKPQ
jgi:hypothetical protein